MKTVQAIFFDAGDTLVFDDPPLPERFLRAVRSVGLPIDETRFPLAWWCAEQVGLAAYTHGIEFVNMDTQYAAANAALTMMGHVPLSERDWKALAAAFLGETYTRYAHPDAHALLQTLKARGFRLGIISDWETTLPDMLAELNIAQYFDVVVTSEEVGVTKPNPIIFQTALVRMGITPGQSLHVGDWRELDIVGAQSVGMRALLFDHAGRSPDAVCPRVETFDALTAYLTALPAP